MSPKQIWPIIVLMTIVAMVFVTGVSADKDGAVNPAANPGEPLEENLPGDQGQQTGAGPVDRQADPPLPDNIQPKPDTGSREFVPPQAGYWLEVSVGEQKVRVYQDGALIKEWLASTGTPEKPTPLGVFNIQNRGEWFYNSKYKQGAKWWVSFSDWGVYLFHTVPMDQEKQIIVEEADKLGTPASHGCVRLEVKNAKWIYDNIPQGVPVYIHS